MEFMLLSMPPPEKCWNPSLILWSQIFILFLTGWIKHPADNSFFIFFFFSVVLILWNLLSSFLPQLSSKIEIWLYPYFGLFTGVSILYRIKLQFRSLASSAFMSSSLPTFKMSPPSILNHTPNLKSCSFIATCNSWNLPQHFMLQALCGCSAIPIFP